MKVITKVPTAHESMIGKPVRIGEKIVGEVVAIEKGRIVSEIDDEFYNQFFSNDSYSIGIKSS